MSQDAPHWRQDRETVRRGEDAPTAVPAKAAVVVASDAAIERLADEIRTFTREAKIAYVLTIGRLVMERFYGGDLALFRSRRRTKDVSIRRLVARLEETATMSRTMLHRCLSFCELAQRAPSVPTLGQIGVSHVYVALSLPEPLQEPLLVRADVEGWTIGRTKQEVEKLRPRKRRRTRPQMAATRRPRFIRDVDRLRPVVQDEGFLSDIDRCRELPVDELREVLGVVTCAMHRLEEATTRMRAALGTLESCGARKRV
jgi:hypothetical protein